MCNKVYLSYSCPAREAEVVAISKILNVDINKNAETQLCATNDKWVLKFKNMQPMWVDFDYSYWRKNFKKSSEALVKACKASSHTTILDLTAGFGRDVAILLTTGAYITMVERDKIMQVLLQDGLLRADSTIKNRLNLISGEASEYLRSLSTYPDVIYLDPMHPIRKKSANVKKHMLALQSWIKPDEDFYELLTLARSHALERVVVKWPAKKDPIVLPSYSIMGKTIRFDVYTQVTSKHI